MKIAAMREAFTDQWVAAKVLKVDKTNVPLTGEVLSHSSEKQEVYQAAKAYLMQHPTAMNALYDKGGALPVHDVGRAERAECMVRNTRPTWLFVRIATRGARRL